MSTSVPFRAALLQQVRIEGVRCRVSGCGLWETQASGKEDWIAFDMSNSPGQCLCRGTLGTTQLCPSPSNASSFPLCLTGYIAFFALMLSIGYEVHASPPEGTQVDWPAILTPRPSDFAKEVPKPRTTNPDT